MRKITNDAIRAFNNREKFSKDNTVVSVKKIDGRNVANLYLFGNLIATHYYNETFGLFISTCGWKSKTTFERLNALSGVRIVQKKGVWYLNGEEWNGNMIKVQGMYYAQFLSNSTGYVEGSTPPRFEPSNVKPIDACGSDGILYLDGRFSLTHMAMFAMEVMEKRSFVGFRIIRANSLREPGRELYKYTK